MASSAMGQAVKVSRQVSKLRSQAAASALAVYPWLLSSEAARISGAKEYKERTIPADCSFAILKVVLRGASQ